jgi:hypothetical protein
MIRTNSYAHNGDGKVDCSNNLLFSFATRKFSQVFNHRNDKCGRCFRQPNHPWR